MSLKTESKPSVSFLHILWTGHQTLSSCHLWLWIKHDKLDNDLLDQYWIMYKLIINNYKTFIIWNQTNKTWESLSIYQLFVWFNFTLNSQTINIIRVLPVSSLKFSSCRTSTCCCSWRNLFPAGVLENIKVKKLYTCIMTHSFLKYNS